MSRSVTGFEDDGETVRVDRGASASIRRVHEISWKSGGATHVLPVERRLVLGAAPDVDVRLEEPTVSRLHAELEPTQDGLWIADLGSKNGTFLNNVRVARAEVTPGSEIRLGRATISVATDLKPFAVALWERDEFHGMRGRSVVMRELFARLARVAVDSATVLVQGETGTGKDLVAQAIHAASTRSEGPFVVVDCAAIPPDLMEAELFGAARGAFTGANANREGAFESANKGTLFLDEIGELPLALQPKLLRAIESRTIRRIGETTPRKTDIRIVCATHRDLREMVNLGAFREDLFFRLAVVPIRVPPLRDRRDDIPLLLERFLSVDSPLSPDVFAEIVARPWLGNVRELRNFTDAARVLGVREALDMLAPTAPAAPSHASADAGLPPVSVDRPFKELKEQWVDHLERHYVRLMLERHRRNISAVADASGLDRAWIYRLMRKHGL